MGASAHCNSLPFLSQANKSKGATLPSLIQTGASSTLDLLAGRKMIFGHTSKEGWLHLSKSSPKTFPQAKICSSKLVPSLACPDDDNDDDGVDDDDDSFGSN